MKTRTLSPTILLCVAVTLSLGFTSSQYQLVSNELLKAQPEKYKNKKIYFETKYLGYATTFPPYMEKSGIKSGKYFYIKAFPRNFPVVALKKKFTEVILALKKRSSVKIYGRVKKFPVTPKRSVFPHYYLELAEIQVTKEPAKVDEDGDDDKLPKLPKWKRRALRKIRNM